jgi:pseudouridine synthase
MEREDSRVHQESIRLNKFLAMAGVGSRRSNDELIRSGAVKVNGRVVEELGVKVNPRRDRVTVRGNSVYLTEKPVHILLNKPKDTITTLKDERERSTVMDYVHVKERVFPVGRLDRNTTGVLLLTNDGELAHALLHPRREVEKVYHLRLDRGITEADVKTLRAGVRLEDGKASAKFVEVIKGTKRRELYMAIHEGRNRQVRRMLESLRYEVEKLERVSFAGLTTAGLARGKWRKLASKEVEHLRSLAGLS